jgi:hypothetical protein
MWRPHVQPSLQEQPPDRASNLALKCKPVNTKSRRALADLRSSADFEANSADYAALPRQIAFKIQN